MMNHSGTTRKPRATFSTDSRTRLLKLEFDAPRSWKELSQDELHWVLKQVALWGDSLTVKTLMLVHFCGWHVIRHTRFGWSLWAKVWYEERNRWISRKFFLSTAEIQSLTKEFAFVDQLEGVDCRLDAVRGLHAANVYLQKGFPFEYFTQAEKYYQGYIASQNEELLDSLGAWLYLDKDGHAAGTGHAVDDDGHKVEEFSLEPWERLSVLAWFSGVKNVLAAHFPYLFKKPVEDPDELLSSPRPTDYMEIYDAELRALTGGDITKEKEVLAMETWRALTELNAKARDAEELERIRKRK